VAIEGNVGAGDEAHASAERVARHYARAQRLLQRARLRDARRPASERAFGGALQRAQ
jgi:hypothetical protein